MEKSYTRTAIYTLDSIKSSRNTVLERWSTSMEIYLKESGKTTRRMAFEDLSFQMVSTVENWLKIKK